MIGMPPSHNPPSAPRPVLREALTLLWSESSVYVRGLLFLTLALTLISSACTAFGPVLFKFAIDSLANLPAPLNLSPLAWVVLYALNLFFVRYLAEQRMYYHGIAEQRLHVGLSERTNTHSFNLPLNYHWSRSANTVEKTLDQGLRGCESILRQFLYTLLPVAIEMIAVCVLLFHFGHPLYLIIFAASALAYGFIYWTGARSSGEAAKAVSSAAIETGSFLSDGFLNIEVLKSFRAVRWFLRLYGERLRGMEKFWRRFYARRRWTGQLAALVFGSSVLVALWVTVNGVKSGQMTVGDLVLIQAYLFRLTMPLEQLGYAAREVSQGMAYLDRLLALLREPCDVDTAIHPLPQTLRGEIAFENVNFSYPSSPHPILQGVSFTIKAGSSVAVVGHNGAGKTTLGRLLLRTYEASAGRITFDGVSLTDISRDDLSDSIVTIPQETILLHTTLRANITLGADVDELRMARVLRLAQLESVVADLPEGLDTVVGQRGTRLSGGQRQRVAIARALLKDAPVILCDEATASLDPQAERELVPVLMRLAQRQTTLFITHRLSIAEHADKILVLDNGRIVQEGSHANLIASKGLYAQLYRQSELSVSSSTVSPHTVLQR